MAFYGDLFRRRGVMAIGEAPLDSGDVQDGPERDLLDLWWREAARVEPRVPGPDDDTMLRTPMAAQRALNALSASRFFAGMTEPMMIGSLKQVRRYFDEPEIRAGAGARIAKAVATRPFRWGCPPDSPAARSPTWAAWRRSPMRSPSPNKLGRGGFGSRAPTRSSTRPPWSPAAVVVAPTSR